MKIVIKIKEFVVRILKYCYQFASRHRRVYFLASGIYKKLPNIVKDKIRKALFVIVLDRKNSDQKNSDQLEAPEDTFETSGIFESLTKIEGELK